MLLSPKLIAASSLLVSTHLQSYYRYRSSVWGNFGAHYFPDAHFVWIKKKKIMNIGGAHFIISEYCSPTFTVCMNKMS